MFKTSITKDSQNCFFKNLNHLVTGDKEAVIPYCVQYDESFLDFMARICNRYGEFLYCEGNEWHIGLNATQKTLPNSYSSTKYESCIDFGDGAALLNPNYLNSTSEDNKVHTNNTTLKKSNGVLAEEYYQPIEDKDYAEFTDYAPHESTLPDFLKSAAAQQNIWDAVLKTVAVAGMKHGTSKVFMDDVNEDYKKYYDGLNDTTSDNKKYEFTNTGSTQINAGFYTEIENGKALAEKHKLELEISTYNHLLLGDKVEHKGVDYVVYQIDGGIINNVEYQKVTLVPYIATITTEVKDSDGNKIESECGTTIGVMTIPEGVTPTKTDDTISISISTTDPITKKTTTTTTITASNIKVYPLPLRQSHIRKASPQRAIVVDKFDPERLGRVRVKYPWQPGNPDATEENKDLGDATPWLRVAYPMASKESGFMFFPKEGDEVLIDYEEGDIERPFVNGSFYSATNKPSVPSSTHRKGAVKSITSDNGHHISFTDTSGTKFVDELIPVLSVLSKFGIKVSSWVENTDVGKYLGGGFEIADYLGVYSITGSTHGRNITISSPAGDVVIDAFTGITINAPHGDVNIVGKNVNIEARNNLTMTSGTNIKQPYFWHKKSWAEDTFGRIGLAIVDDVNKFGGFDMSFHRTWLEVLLRPIGGTMLIKSHRYMHLEAGEGKTAYAKKVKNKVLTKIGQGVFLHRLIEEVGGSGEDVGKLRANDMYTYDETQTAICKYQQMCEYLGEMYKALKSIKGYSTNQTSRETNQTSRETNQTSRETDQTSNALTKEQVKNWFNLNFSDWHSCELKNYLKNYDTNHKMLIAARNAFNEKNIDFGGLNNTITQFERKREEFVNVIGSATNIEDGLQNISSIELEISINNIKDNLKAIYDRIITKFVTDNWEDIIEVNGALYRYKKSAIAKRIVKLGFKEFLKNNLLLARDIYDDDTWSKNDKGKILFSNDKNTTFYMDKSETLKRIESMSNEDIETVIKKLNDWRTRYNDSIDRFFDSGTEAIETVDQGTESGHIVQDDKSLLE